MFINVAVEGQGELEAVPLMLRRCLLEKERYDVEIARPMRIGGVQNILNGATFVRQFDYISGDPNSLGLLLTADCDDGCVVEVRNAIVRRITKDCTRPRTPVGIVLFNKEFESLFLSQADRLAEVCDFFTPDDAASLIRVAETARGAKRLVRNAIKEFTYKESRDQVKLCAGLDIGLLEARHRAGRRVKSAIGQILAGESDIAYG